MDLVIVQPNFVLKGGAENVILHIAKKYNPIIYTFIYDKQNTWAGLKDFDIRVIKPFRMNSTFMLKTCKEFYSFKVKHDYDVINSHWPPSHWSRNHNERMLWYCHSPSRAMYDLYHQRMKEYNYFVKPGFWAFSKYYRNMNKPLVDMIEKVVCNSANTQKRLQQFLGKSADIINPCIALDDFKNNDYKKYFFYPSRITSNKRIEYAIKAFSIFKKKYPDFRLIIAGSIKENDSNYFAYLKTLGQAEFRLNVPEKEYCALYSNAYAVLFTGLDEDFGITPLEGMASQKPVISVNEGGPKETILNNKTGYLVDSINEMAQKMVYLAEHPDMVEKLGKEGRKHVKDNYTWPVFLRKFDDALKEVKRI